MFFKEVVVQGLFGVSKGLRLPLSEGLCEPLIPPPLDAHRFKNIITMVLYPYDALNSGTLSVDITSSPAVRLGALLCIDGVDYKLVWDLKADSIQVFKVQGEQRDLVASGREEVQALWQQKLGLLPFEYFPILHFHEFPEANPELEPGDERGKLIAEYRRAMTIEKLELDIESFAGRLRELTTAKTPAAKVEKGLGKINTRLHDYDRLPELSDAQREFLESYDSNLKQRQAELNEAHGGHDDTKMRRSKLNLGPLVGNRLFWLGIVVGLACSAAAFFMSDVNPRFRSIAFGNILGFGIATFALVRHLGDHEKNLVYEKRVQHLEGRTKELDKLIRNDGIRLKRIGDQFGSKQANQILADVNHRDALLAKRTALEAQLRKHLVDPDFIKQREEVESLKERQAELKTRRATFGDFVLPTHELRPALEEMGVAIKSLKPMEISPEAPLMELARRFGVIKAGVSRQPAEELEALNKLVPPLIGGRDAQVAIGSGQLVVGANGTAQDALAEMSDRAQKPWLRAISLSLMLHYNKQRRQSSDHLSVLVLANPWTGMQRDERVRFYQLLKEVAKAFQVILPKTGD